MGTKEYRMKKMEYYGRPMGALNLYMYLLLPAFVLYSAVMFVWHATVTSAQFASPAEFLTNLILLILAIAALVSVYGADRYAFFSNVLFLPVLALWRILSTFSPTLFEPAPAIGAAADVSSSVQTIIDGVLQNISTITQGVQTFAAGLPEGLQTAASQALEILSSAFMGGGMEMMGGMGGMGGMGDMGMGMMDAGMMGMDGMAGEGAAGGSLIAKLVGLFVKTGDDITLFVSTIECGLFVLLCLFFFFFFIKHAKFFLTPLDRFRARDELA